MENLEKLHGVGKTTADKLKNGGYNTIEAIAKARPAILAKKIGIFPAVAERIVNSAKKITKARIAEEETISESEIKRKEREEIEKSEKSEEKEIFGEKPKGKIPLSETHTPVLAEVLKRDGDMFKEVVKEAASNAAKYIKELAEFKEKILNAALKNMDFRQRLVNRIAENLCDD